VTTSSVAPAILQVFPVFFLLSGWYTTKGFLLCSQGFLATIEHLWFVRSCSFLPSFLLGFLGLLDIVRVSLL